LGVDRIGTELFAEDGVGFPEVDAFGAAEFVEPEAGQIAEVAEAALGREGEEFELVFVEIGFRGDLEGATVIFCAAYDYQGAFYLFAAADDAEVREFVAEDFAGALVPVGEDAYAGF